MSCRVSYDPGRSRANGSRRRNPKYLLPMRRPTTFVPDPALHARLEALRGASVDVHRASDPVDDVHRAAPEDREVVAFFAALLAFGNVKAIRASIATFLGRLGDSPTRAVRRWGEIRTRRPLKGFRHRWVGEEDLDALMRSVAGLLDRFGTLERAFAAGDTPDAETTLPGLAAFADRLEAGAGRDAARRGVKFLVAHPERGGAAKRMNLFLRWMVRPADGIDFGLWRSPSPSRLVIPLDVHIAFQARVLGLSRRRTPGMAMALEITRALRRFDAADPLRYDFSLCHLGIHGDCRGHRVAHVCASCPLDPWCRLPKRR